MKETCIPNLKSTVEIVQYGIFIQVNQNILACYLK